MDIQHHKDKASLIQRHLADEGLRLKRTSALNLVAKLDGYRSHTVAKRGQPHVRPAVVWRTKGATAAAVEASFVEHEGAHCPNCGSRAIYDACNAACCPGGWEVQMGCKSCDGRWFTVYRLDAFDGMAVPEGALSKAREGVTACIACAHDDVEYSTFIAGRRGHQLGSCTSCGASWAESYRVAGLAYFLEDGIEQAAAEEPNPASGASTGASGIAER